MSEKGLFADTHAEGGAAPTWPIWELQAHGSGSPGPAQPSDARDEQGQQERRDGQDGPAGREAEPGTGAAALPPWADVRLTFADGARMDVMVVLTGDGVGIEDLRAEPPLPLGGLASLGARIGEPLADACRVLVADGRPPGSGDGPGSGSGDGGDSDPESTPGGYGAGARQPSPAPPRPTAPGRRARPGWPRGSEGLKVVAEAYLAAQEAGRDPVLAVMGTTGRSRRRSLRLIAAARDKGRLAPRHNRRR